MLRDAYQSLRAAADRAIAVAFKSSADAGPPVMHGVRTAMCLRAVCTVVHNQFRDR